ncbi:MAG TPA: energy transducer TonB [Candidatus Acidoferrales bacterium]|nr:energy transducer TonB [Candidatus Acidoferrales bacterium]
MKRHNSGNKLRLGALARILIVSLVFLTMTTATRAGDKSSKDAAARAQAVALFQKALEVEDIRAPGSPPFELQGTIVVHGGGQKDATGTYLLKWASPEKWREEVRFTDFWQIRVGGTDQYWQARSEQFGFDLEAAWDKCLNFLPLLRYWAKPASIAHVDETKIQTRKIEGTEATCVTLMVKQRKSAFEYCFDAENSSLLSYGKTPPYYSQFLAYAGKLYPGKFRTNTIWGQTLEFSASSLRPLGPSDPAQFQPLLNAEVWRACDTRDSLARVIHEPLPTYPPIARGSGIHGTVWVYGVIGADGRLHRLRVIGSPNSLLASSALDSFKQWVYEPEICNGRPVPVETMLTATFTLGP